MSIVAADLDAHVISSCEYGDVPRSARGRAPRGARPVNEAAGRRRRGEAGEGGARRGAPPGAGDHVQRLERRAEPLAEIDPSNSVVPDHLLGGPRHQDGPSWRI